jgi:hypothetical protein
MFFNIFFYAIVMIGKNFIESSLIEIIERISTHLYYTYELYSKLMFDMEYLLQLLSLEYRDNPSKSNECLFFYFLPGFLLQLVHTFFYLVFLPVSIRLFYKIQSILFLLYLNISSFFSFI